MQSITKSFTSLQIQQTNSRGRNLEEIDSASFMQNRRRIRINCKIRSYQNHHQTVPPSKWFKIDSNFIKIKDIFENISHLAIHNTFETVIFKFTHRWRLQTKKYIFSFCY